MSGKPSEFPAVRRENVGADDNPTISVRLGQICYILVCLQILFFCYLSIADWNIYVSVIREDGGIEYLTVVAFLLAGIVSFAAALIERRLFPRCVYVLGGMVMMMFAGEEINWGQRIIGFDTPDFMMDLNYKGEFNLHNIIGSSAYRSYYVLSTLCIAAAAAFFCGKGRIFGIPALPITLTLAVLAMMSYVPVERVGLLEILRFIVSPHHGLLLLLLLFALFSQNARLFIATAASMSLALSVSYLINQNEYIDYLEVYEYLLSVICFIYALAALLDNGVARQKIMAAVAVLKPAVALPSVFIKSPPPPDKTGTVLWNIKWNRLTPWTLICLLIIAGSVGLAFTTYFKDRAELAAVKEIYLLAQTTEPTARSNFDLYIDGRDLHYFKQPCDASDVGAPFFLGIFPDDIDVLPNNQRRHGFANHDFYFIRSNGPTTRRGGEYGYMLDGACIVTARLPDYEIASVSTGQYTFDDDGVATNLWIAEFPVGSE